MTDRHLYDPILQGVRAAAYLLSHLVLASIIIAGIYGIDRLIVWLGDYRLFDTIPLRYVFDAVDIPVLIVFSITGAMEAYDVFRNR